MKFAKLLARNIALSSPAWADHFISYKALKKILATRATPLTVAASNNASLAAVLAACPEEVTFFGRLQEELVKVSSFFDSAEAALAASYAALVEAFKSHGVAMVSARIVCLALVIIGRSFCIPKLPFLPLVSCLRAVREFKRSDGRANREHSCAACAMCPVLLAGPGPAKLWVYQFCRLLKSPQEARQASSCRDEGCFPFQMRLHPPICALREDACDACRRRSNIPRVTRSSTT